MAVTKQSLHDYLKDRAKLDGLPDVVGDPMINKCIELGGAEFWTADWEFAKVHDSFSLTVGQSDYQLNTAATLDISIDSVCGVKRMTADDHGRYLRIMTENEFDELYPYPESYANGNPKSCKIYKNSGNLWLALYPPPDAADTLEVVFRLGWKLDRLALIPDQLFGVVCLYCRAYMTPEERQYAMFRLADDRRDKALNRENRPVRQRLTTKPLPFEALNRGESWDALDIEN